MPPGFLLGASEQKGRVRMLTGSARLRDCSTVLLQGMIEISRAEFFLLGLPDASAESGGLQCVAKLSGLRIVIEGKNEASIMHGGHEVDWCAGASGGGLMLNAFERGEKVGAKLSEAALAILRGALCGELAFLPVHLEAETREDQAGRGEDEQEKDGLPFGKTILNRPGQEASILCANSGVYVRGVLSVTKCLPTGAPRGFVPTEDDASYGLTHPRGRAYGVCQNLHLSLFLVLGNGKSHRRGGGLSCFEFKRTRPGRLILRGPVCKFSLLRLLH